MDCYEGRLTGEKFQAVYLPEISLSINPDLRFAGTMMEMELTGGVMVHKAQIQQSEREGMVKISGDVIIMDRPQPKKKPSAFGLNTWVTMALGDAFVVRAGVARLDDRILLVSKGFNELSLEGNKTSRRVIMIAMASSWISTGAIWYSTAGLPRRDSWISWRFERFGTTVRARAFIRELPSRGRCTPL